RLTGADERRRDLESESEELRRRVAETDALVAESERLATEAERTFRQLEDEERSLTEQEEMSTEGAIAVVRGDLRSLDMADERDRRELEAVETRAQAVKTRISDEKATSSRI